MTKITLFILTIFLFSCGTSPDKENYLSYFNQRENGFVKQKELGDLFIKVSYLPPEQLVFKESDQNTSQEDIQTGLKNYEQSLNFMLQIGAKGDQQIDVLKALAEDYESYELLVHTLSFNTEEFFQLETLSGKIDPSIAHFERGLSANGVQTLHVSFPKPEDDQVTFCFENIDIQIAKIKFSFDLSDLNIPPIPKS